MANLDFVGQVQQQGVRLCLTGDVHESRRDAVRYWHESRQQMLGAGSFGAPRDGLPHATPRLYKLLEVDPNRSRSRVHTRQQAKPNSAWEPWFEWPDPKDDSQRVAYFDVELT